MKKLRHTTIRRLGVIHSHLLKRLLFYDKKNDWDFNMRVDATLLGKKVQTIFPNKLFCVSV